MRRNDARNTFWFLLLLIGLWSYPSVADWWVGEPENVYEAAEWLSQSSRKRNKAILFLEQTGPQHRQGIPVLIQALENDRHDVRDGIQNALKRIGPSGRESVPELVQIVDKSQGVTQVAAIRALGQVGAEAGAASPLLVRLLLKDPSGDLADASSEALVRIGGPAADALVESITQLKEQNGEQYSRLMAVLYKIGKPSVIALTQALGTNAEKDRGLLRDALTEVSQEVGGKAIPDLRVLVAQNHPPEVRIVGVEILAKIARHHPAAVEDVIAALRDSHESVRQSAARSLPEIGTSAVEPILSALETEIKLSVENPAPDVREVNPAPRDLIPTFLLSLIQSRDVGEREELRQLLVPALSHDPVRQLTDTNAPLRNRERATAALLKLGRDAQDAIPTLMQALTHKDPTIRADAASVLAGFVPFLDRVEHLLDPRLQRLSQNHVQIRRAVTKALGDVGAQGNSAETTRMVVDQLITLLADADADVQANAVQSLGRIGVQASPAAPHLLKRLRREGDLDRSVIHALGQIGPAVKVASPDTVAALLQTLKNEDERIKRESIEALGQIEAEETVDELIALLDDPKKSRRFRPAIIVALGQIHAQPNIVIPRLMTALDNNENEPSLRDQASRSLGRFGPEAVKVLLPIIQSGPPQPENKRTAEAERSRLRYFRALHALKYAGPAVEPTTTLLIDILKETAASPTMRVAGKYAAEALATVGKPAVPKLIPLLKGTDAEVRQLTASTLGRIGSDARPAIPVLLTAFAQEKKEWQFRVNVLNALTGIQKEADSVQDQLFLAWNDEHPQVRARAIRLSRDLPWKNGKLMAAFEKALQEKESEKMRLVGELLAQTSLEGMSRDQRKRLVQLLHAHLKSDRHSLHKLALESLRRLAPTDSTLLDRQIVLLKQGENSVGSAVMENLRAIGAPAVDPLLWAFKAEQDALKRGRIVRALGKLGNNAGPAVRPLLQILEANQTKTENLPQWEYRSALEALGEIGPPAISAVPRIARALVHPDKWTRNRAAQALGAILRPVSSDASDKQAPVWPLWAQGFEKARGANQSGCP